MQLGQGSETWLQTVLARVTDGSAPRLLTRISETSLVNGCWAPPPPFVSTFRSPMQIDRDKRRAAQTDTNGKHVEAVETEQRFGESYIVQHRRGFPSLGAAHR